MDPIPQPQTGSVGAESQPAAEKTDLGLRSDALLCLLNSAIVSEGGRTQGLNRI